jgi:Spy/CpxP family protein refolding chaperone
MLARAASILTCCALLGCAAGESHRGHAQSAYPGQQSRDVKALSADEVSGYLTGAGMGFAKAAELNGYPGPMHAIENAAALSLTPDQHRALDALMKSHKQEVRALGTEVVRLERDLDALFASKAATPAAIDLKVAGIAAAQASVRASHLKTHLKTAELLSTEQIARYQAARGYGS